MGKRAAAEVAFAGVAAALLIGVQVGMSFLPNIELVSFLIILFTKHFGKRTLFAIYVFVIVEGLLYGFGIWWFMYLYVWAILFLAAWIFRRMESILGWTVLSGLFGLFFGTFCSVVYILVNGWRTGVAGFISGIPYDLAHCAGNIVAILVLYIPMNRVARMIAQKMFPEEHPPAEPSGTES